MMRSTIIPRKRVILNIAAGILLIGIAFLAAAYRTQPTADEVSFMQEVGVGGNVNFTDGRPASGMIVFIDGHGVATDQEGYYLSRILVPSDQLTVGVQFIDNAGKPFRVTQGDESALYIDSLSVHHDFVIEPVAP